MTTGERGQTRDFSQPQEAYVEVIGALLREKGTVSITSLADRMGVTLPSASEAVGRLVGLGLVMRISRFEIGLTDQGRRIAEQLDRRHESLRQFMTNVLAMDKVESDKIACRLEHYVDGDFAGRLARLAELLNMEYAKVLDDIARRMRAGKAGKRAHHGEGSAGA